MNENFSYAVKFQKRKTLGLYVLLDGSIEVRAPMRTAHKYIVQFVEQKADWILKTSEQQLQRRQWQTAIEPGSSVWLLGKSLPLAVRKSNSIAVHHEAERLLIAVRDPLNLPVLARHLHAWYRAQAQTIFSERLLLVCQRFPGILPAPELRLRRMKRRWGSCSRGGRVTLNIDLVKLPLTLIDYVIAHELCHLFEFNHGKKFYQLLEFAMPDWKQREAMLKQF